MPKEARVLSLDEGALERFRDIVQRTLLIGVPFPSIRVRERVPSSVEHLWASLPNNK
jgi:hypothetical protein